MINFQSTGGPAQTSTTRDNNIRSTPNKHNGRSNHNAKSGLYGADPEKYQVPKCGEEFEFDLFEEMTDVR